MNAIGLDRVVRVDGGRTRVAETSLQIDRGTITVLGGRNGAGKSTLLSLIAGEIAPSSGAITLLGHDPRTRDAQALARDRALLDQDAPAPVGFTVAQVVSWGRRCWRGTTASSEDDAVVAAMLDEHGITHLAERQVHELSGGERSRVHLARVRAQRAPILLLDEADADLDLEGRYHLDQAILREAASGTAVIVVSHDLQRLTRVANRLLLIDKGTVIADGPPGQVATAERLAAHFGIPASAITARTT